MTDTNKLQQDAQILIDCVNNSIGHERLDTIGNEPTEYKQELSDYILTIQQK